MSIFITACNKTLKFEGGYSDNSADTGGKTKYGITEAVARENGYIGEMIDFPLDKAMTIYEKSYWTPLRLNEIDNQDIADYLFDMAVNHGTVRAGIIFQVALNLFCNSHLETDGLIGDRTMQVFKGMRLDENYLFLISLKGLRYKYYYDIVKNNPSQQIFYKGWLRRV